MIDLSTVEPEDDLYADRVSAIWGYQTREKNGCFRGRAGDTADLPAPLPVMVRRAEGFLEKPLGGQAGHHDHRPQCDVLEDHRQPFVLAMPGHHLGLGAKVAKEVCRRHCHISRFYHRSNTLRNRLAAGFSVFRASESSTANDSRRNRFQASPNAT